METATINTPHNTIPTGISESVKPASDLGHTKLLSCLYFIFDAMERAGLEFFLVKDTAKKAMTEYMLEGDHIDVGLRINEWQNDQKDILFMYFQDERVEQTKDEPKLLEFVWNDVPFRIHLYPDSMCTLALVPIVYEHETWRIPNRFDIFEKEYDK
jgi:hypothetical protein